MKRSAAAACAVLAVAALTGGCSSPAAPMCEGGDVRLRQGIPHDLPGGGSVGFTETEWDADPPTVHLLMGGDVSGDPPYDLVVGDAFTIGGTSYEVTCIAQSVVTLDER